jgi:CDP-diacylglycerol--glycerol-3-phosphate 3-phosphatidyltransferase
MTDWLDGYLARKMGLSSEFGAFLDPVADKLMVATTLVLLCTWPPAMAWARVAPWLLPLPAIVIIGREITMSAVREWAASQGGDIHKTVAVNKLGKFKTVLQMVALTLLLANRNGGYAPYFPFVHHMLFLIQFSDSQLSMPHSCISFLVKNQ